MKSDKDERLADAIFKLAAQYVSRESNRKSLITITRASIHNRGKNATVYFTVLPDSEELKILKFLSRKKNDFRKYVTDKKIVGFAPIIQFSLDLGEKNRQRIDSLSKETILDTDK